MLYINMNPTKINYQGSDLLRERNQLKPSRMRFRPVFSLPMTIIMSTTAASASKNTSYTNPGWHSDPSCTFVPESDNTFFCTTSSLLTFPGIPVYASNDLIHWKLASHVVTRPTQVPEIGYATSQTQQDGL
jgi:hypothetical protein